LTLVTYVGFHPTCHKRRKGGPYRNSSLSETRSRRNDTDID
jgi:hypothetical protein